MSKVPQLTAIELVKILRKIGFEVIRQQGSHMFLKNNEGGTTVIPNHPGEKLDRGLLNKILKKDVGITREKFEEII